MMTLKKILPLVTLTSFLFGVTTPRAEDIDLFRGGATVTGNKPNVLIIVDNSANWSAANQGWPGGIKQGESELNAMGLVLGALTEDVRVGLMMFTEGTGSDYDGGYVRFAIRDMDTPNRTALQAILSNIKPNFDTPTEKVGTAKSNYDNAMYEAFKYFSGSTRYAHQDVKRDYTGNGAYNISPYTAGNLSHNALSNSTTDQYNRPLSLDAPCSKNFIIFIGNGFPVQTGPNPTTLGDAALGNFNATQVFNASPTSKNRYADEWARFLNQYGAAAPCETENGATTCANSKVAVYTIDVYKDAQDMDQTALLKSMAAVGGGKYFAATSEAEIQAALNAIFNEVQAVNSVFTSASLPVSVNTQGTYLNQIYMGVFRPDEGGRPRWFGNLKQYKFGLTTDALGNDVIFLADADGQAAVNSQTGFVSTTARSYWTTTTAPNPGFWAFSPKGAGGQYDSPDGDLVEKGAAAQKLRTLGPTSRTVYTCTPACTANNTPSSFATTNAALMTALSGTTSSVTLSRSGPTVTGTTSGSLGLATPTDTVTISGSSVAAYNGPWTVTPGSGNTFTFTISETPATPATGSTMTVSSGSSVSQTVNSVTFDAGTGKANVFLPAHGFINNQTITMAGATPTNYNGTFGITVVDANNFTFTPTLSTVATETLPAINSSSAVSNGVNCGGTSFNLAKIRRDTGSSTVTVVTSANSNAKCKAGAAVVIGGVTAVAGYNSGVTGNPASWTISGTDGACLNFANLGSNNNSTFCYTMTVPVTTTTVNPASPATGAITATGVPTRAVTSITRTAGNSSNVATVTVTTAVPHGFSGASSVTVLGADQTEYNGSKTTAANSLAFPTATTLTYTLTTGPTASASGTAGRGSSVDPTVLINWTRGMDNREDENANASLTDVRASVHGDVLHSRPLVINYGGTTGVMAFYGANDGTLRAVKGGQDDSTDGVEKWAFVAPEHYSSLPRIYNNSPLIKFPTTSMSIVPTPSKRDYFFDGNIGVYQTADLATTHIFASMRRGGRFVYAFDVSNPDLPKFLWKKSNVDTGFAEMGQTWSEPKVIRLRKTAGMACSATDPNTYVRGLIFGAGYDPVEEDKDNQGASGVVRNPTMGRGVFVLNAADGSLIKLLQPSDTKKYSFPSEVTVMDTTGSGCINRVYAVDTGANIWRFDIGDANPDNWKTYKLAALGDTGDNGGSDDRKFLYPPDAVNSFVLGSPVTYVMVGTGDRERPLSTNIQDMFFMVKDSIAEGTDSATVTPVTISDMTQVTDFNASTTTINPADATFKGWYIPYETGEKSVNAPLTVAGVTFFGTNKPKSADTSNTRQCIPNLGIARGYEVNFLTGTAAVGDRDASGTINRTDLYSVFTGGGLPPSPVSGVVKINDLKTVRFIIGGGGSGITGSTIEGTKIQAAPSTSRTRVYWYFEKD